MDEAKAAVKDFTSKHGNHDTTVYEHHHPAVTHEHVTPTRHENKTTAIDREVHQEHHHTTLQPIRHREVLPEKHHHNLIAVEHREHHHGDPNVIKERLTQERAQFKDVSETGEIQHSHSILPVVTGEHIHHHVHEYIQPIIQKETIQPTVVHTTIPIHEIHHNEAKHHAASALAAMSLADWKKNGGSLKGREMRKDYFKGEPYAETPEQHAKHGGIHLHGITAERQAADEAAVADTSRKGNVLHKHDTHNESHKGRDAALAAGAVGTAAAVEEHHHHKTANRADPRVDAPAAVPESPTSDRLSHHSGSLRSHGTDRTSMSSPDRDAANKYADTHVGSNMDEAAAAGAAVPHHSHGDAANVKRGTILTKDGPVEKRRTSLFKRLNPRKDNAVDERKVTA